MKKENISFTKLGEEECESCELYEQHLADCEHLTDTDIPCNLCDSYKKHIEMAKTGREFYRLDREVNDDEDTIYLSSDMQKVIMLPRMPGFKTAVFQGRLTTYHQTFSPLGKGKKNLGVLWHDGIAKRYDEDIASAYVLAVTKHFRDKDNIVIWADNCSVQNKNWTLFTALVTLVNLDLGPCEITLKFFEKGHTFMSCDSFHHKIEQGMREKKSVYDFDDFVSIVRDKGIAYEMKSTDFVDFPNGMSNGAYASSKPLLRDVRIVQFRKGDTNMFWKNSYDQRSYMDAPFLKKKIKQRIEMHRSKMPFDIKPTMSFVSAKRKNGIWEKLCPLMPPSRRQFWNDLQTAEVNSEDEVDE